MRDNHPLAVPDGPERTMLNCAHCGGDSVAVSMPAGETRVAPIHALMIAGARYCARCDSILCENCGGPDMSTNSIMRDCSDAMFRAQREEQERAGAEMRESYRSSLEGAQANPDNMYQEIVSRDHLQSVIKKRKLYAEVSVGTRKIYVRVRIEAAYRMYDLTLDTDNSLIAEVWASSCSVYLYGARAELTAELTA